MWVLVLEGDAGLHCNKPPSGMIGVVQVVGPFRTREEAIAYSPGYSLKYTDQTVVLLDSPIEPTVN